MGKVIVKGWGVYLLYFGILSVLLWRFRLELVWLWVGAMVGAFVLGLDHLVYVVAFPHELTPQRVIQLLGARRFREALSLLVSTTEERTRLYFRQALGQVVLIILAIYLLTSSGGLFGKGLILSANLGILVEEWRGVLGDMGKLNRWLFQHVRDEVDDQTVKEYVFVVTLVFLILTGVAVFY